MKRNVGEELRRTQARYGVFRPTDQDRLAELVVRHALGEYKNRPRVQQRLNALFAAPTSQLQATEEALLKACEHLGVAGDHLHHLVDRLPTSTTTPPA